VLTYVYTVPKNVQVSLLISVINVRRLKGQSHEKVGELWVWDVSLGSTVTKNNYRFLNFKILKCDFSKFLFC
jgi:hypothetical protein